MYHATQLNCVLPEMYCSLVACLTDHFTLFQAAGATLDSLEVAAGLAIHPIGKEEGMAKVGALN